MPKKFAGRKLKPYLVDNQRGGTKMLLVTSFASAYAIATDASASSTITSSSSPKDLNPSSSYNILINIQADILKKRVFSTYKELDIIEMAVYGDVILPGNQCRCRTVAEMLGKYKSKDRIAACKLPNGNESSWHRKKK